MEYSEQVLVLQVGKFKEADIWVRLLSPSRGVFSAFAFGGSRSKQRFPGCLDIFNHVLFRIKSSNIAGYESLQEGVLLKGVSRLRNDWGRLGVAQNCTKFLQSFGVGTEGATKAHALFTDILEFLETDQSVPTLFPLFFRARMAFDHGYSIETNQCYECGKALFDGVLLVREGSIFCPECAPFLQGMKVRLRHASLLVLDAIKKNSPSSWGNIELPSAVRIECSMAIDGFIQHHVGLSWNNGRFSRV